MSRYVLNKGKKKVLTFDLEGEDVTIEVNDYVEAAKLFFFAKKIQLLPELKAIDKRKNIHVKIAGLKVPVKK